MVVKTIGNPFQNCPVYMSVRMSEGQSYQRPPSHWILDGGLLTQEVWKEDQSLGAGGDLFSRFIQAGVAAIWREFVPEPLDQTTAGGHAAASNILPWDIMVI